jgi:hypothetical protein
MPLDTNKLTPTYARGYILVVSIGEEQRNQVLKKISELGSGIECIVQPSEDNRDNLLVVFRQLARDSPVSEPKVKAGSGPQIANVGGGQILVAN